MRNVLAITACLKRCSIAISYENNVYKINENVDASANLAYLTSKLIKSHNVDLKKIGGIITASGPGSFTGIRVAQSLAKGMALSLKIPSASVDYFDVIDNILSKKQLNRIVLIKSEKDQVYFKFIKSDNTPNEIGVSSYENLNLKDDLIVIDDMGLDFRKAKYLLNFSNLITETSCITPLYINARS